MNSRQIFQMILSRTVFQKAKTQVAVVARGLLHLQHVLGADTDSGQLRSEILTSYRLKEPENNSCMRASVAFPPQSGVPGPVGWLGSPTGDSSGYVQPTDKQASSSGLQQTTASILWAEKAIQGQSTSEARQSSQCSLRHQAFSSVRFWVLGYTRVTGQMTPLWIHDKGTSSKGEAVYKPLRRLWLLSKISILVLMPCIISCLSSEH